MKRTSKLIAIALVLVLAIGMLPFSAMATGITGILIKGVDISGDLEDVTATNMVAWNGNGTTSLGAGVGANSEANFPLNAVSIPYEKMNNAEDIIKGPGNYATWTSIKKISQAEYDNFFTNAFAVGGQPATFQNTFKSYGTAVSGNVKIEAGEMYAIFMQDAASTPSNVHMFFIEIVQSNKSGGLGGGGTGTIGGGSTVQKGGINVVLPLNLNFVLDPLMLKSDVPGNQFSGTDFQIMNKSEIPVRVKFDIMAKANAGSTFVASGPLVKADPNYKNGAGSTPNDMIKPLTAQEVNGNGKKFSMGILSAYIATAQPNFTTNAGGAYKYRIEETGAYIPMSTTATPSSAFATTSSINFLLAKPASQGVYADNFGSIAAFKFFGQLTAGSDWKKNDIEVTGAYTISGFTTEGYAEKYGSQMFGLNGWNGDEDYRNFAADARIEQNKVTRIIVSRAAATANGGITVALRTDNTADPKLPTNPGDPATPPENKPLSSIGSIVNKTKTYTFTASDYSYLNMNGVLTIKSFPTDSVYNEIVITFGAGASAVTYTLWLSVV